MNITQPDFDIYTQFNTLKVSLTEDTNMIEIYFNNELKMSYDMDLLDLPLNYKINNIGLQNNGVSVNTKSLYIAGVSSPFIIPSSSSTPISTDSDININTNTILNPTKHDDNDNNHDKFVDSALLVASSTTTPSRTDEFLSTEFLKKNNENRDDIIDNDIGDDDDDDIGDNNDNNNDSYNTKDSITLTMSDFSF